MAVTHTTSPGWCTQTGTLSAAGQESHSLNRLSDRSAAPPGETCWVLSSLLQFYLLLMLFPVILSGSTGSRKAVTSTLGSCAGVRATSLNAVSTVAALSMGWLKLYHTDSPGIWGKGGWISTSQAGKGELVICLKWQCTVTWVHCGGLSNNELGTSHIAALSYMSRSCMTISRSYKKILSQ